MTDVNEQVAVPQNSSVISQALVKLVSDLVANQKAGLTGISLVTADISATISDLVGALGSLGGVAGEFAVEPIGVAEAFAVAGFELARSLSGK